MKKPSIAVAVFMTVLLQLNFLSFGQKKAYKVPEFAKEWGKSGKHPDHIVINLSDDPARKASVTWRTSTEISEGYAEIAVATSAPKFWRNARTYKAKTETMDASNVLTAEVISNYHSVTFEGLIPDTLYAYRVGNGRIWSEWIQFRTASEKPKPFSFLYVGDAQNYLLELWSRLVREGYRKAPDARFIIHAGDLVNDAHSERQWHEWFTAGGWIHSMLPSVPIAGNHEYEPYTAEEEEKDIDHLSIQWKPQFTLPLNGPDGLEETAYYIDYQGVRIIGLNTLEKQPEQAKWLEKVLSDNPNTWTVVTYHHPLFSASEGRDNKMLRYLWKPVFDKYSVDLALQGHDHSYARGRVDPSGQNVVSGLNTRDKTGTVYVVSVSGGKMYELKPDAWDSYEAQRDRAAENTQLFQVINVDGNKLSYEAYTATGELYDAFDLIKPEDGSPNKFIERKQEAVAARRFNNTIPYQDVLPRDIRENLANKYKGYKFDKINYVDTEGFRGYFVELENEDTEINLKISPEGELLSETIEKD